MLLIFHDPYLASIVQSLTLKSCYGSMCPIPTPGGCRRLFGAHVKTARNLLCKYNSLLPSRIY